MTRYSSLILFYLFTAEQCSGQVKLDDIVAVWKTVQYKPEQRDRGIEIKGTHQFLIGKDAITFEGVIRIKGNNVLAESTEIENGAVKQTACCKGDLYSFQTKKKNEAHTLVSFQLRNESESSHWSKGCVASEYSLADSYLTVAGYFLPKLVLLKGAKCNVGIEKDGLVKLSVLYPHTVKEVNGSFEPFQGGTFWLDPTNNYFPVRSEIDKSFANGSYRTATSIRYPDGNTVEYETIETLKVDSKNIIPQINRQSGTTRFDYQSNIDESIFTLTAFGLPEPAGSSAAHNKSGYLMWIYFTISILVVGCLIFSYLRRSASLASSKRTDGE